MTQEDKELLLKDLSARLPYSVKIWYKPSQMSLTLSPHILDGLWCEIDKCKPYLRSLSSMTKEEREEFENLLEGIVDGIERWDKPDLCEEYDWLNSHHFDYRGLIEKDLALEAPEGMYN